MTRLSQGLTASTSFAHAHTAGGHQIASEMGTPRGPQNASEMGMGVPISRGSTGVVGNPSAGTVIQTRSIPGTGVLRKILPIPVPGQ